MQQVDPIDDALKQAEQENFKAAIQALIRAFDQLNDELSQLESAQTEVKQELEDQPDIEWAGPNPTGLKITSSEAGNTVYPFKAIKGRVLQEEYEYLEERVRRLEDGDADVVIRGETDADQLPIERKLAERQAGGDLTANQARATLIFQKFGVYGETRGGSQFVLPSSDVRTILRETTDRTDWPNETIKRAMQWTAKLTSQRAEAKDRDPRDDENLLTLQTGRDGSLELVADLDEFREFFQNRTEDQE